jgi:hypothetical protein
MPFSASPARPAVISIARVAVGIVLGGLAFLTLIAPTISARTSSPTRETLSLEDAVPALTLAAQPPATGLGSDITVSILISNVADLGTYEIEVTYGGAVVSPTDVADGGFLGSTGRAVFPTGPDNAMGRVTFGAFTLGTAPNGPSGSGVLAQIRFKLISCESTPIMLSRAQLGQIDGSPIAITLGNTQVGCAPPTPTPGPGSTASATPTPHNTATPSATPTNAPTDTPTLSPIETAASTVTSTPTSTSTNTPTLAPSNTPTPTPTHTPTATPTPIPTAAIGDRVWQDTSGNGRQDPGETGVGGVTVTLRIWDGVDDFLTLATTRTGSTGLYLFTGLAPGDYVLVFTLPSGYAFTAQHAPGATQATDSDADPTTGETDFISLAPGTDLRTYDAGLIPLPTPTASPTNSPTATSTNTHTATPTATSPATPTDTPTPTNTDTSTPTVTFTATATTTPTATPTTSPTASPTPTNTPTATPIGVPGATAVLVLSDSSTVFTATNAHFEVPVGAVTETITLVYLPSPTVTGAPSGSSWMFAGRSFTLTAYQNGEALPQFSFQRPITVVLEYSDFDLVGLDELKLLLYYLDTSTGAWLTDGITVVFRDIANKRIVFSVAHLSRFGLFAPERHMTFLPRVVLIAPTPLLLVNASANHQVSPHGVPK